MPTIHANYANTYEAVGNREDLLDIITNISPDETPLMNKFGRSKVTGMVHSWLTDTLPDPIVNAQKEDAAFTETQSMPREKEYNYVQIFMRDCNVTDSQEAVLKAGVKSEMAYQLAKTLKAIALDVEKAIVTNSTRVRGGEGGVPGVNYDADNNANTEGPVALPQASVMGGVPFFNTVNTVTAPATGELTEPLLNDAIQKAWAKGGTPDICVVSGKNKRTISEFTGNATRQRNADSTKIKQIVDVYESDFGLVNMVLHRLQPNTRVDLLQTEYWKLAYLIPFKTYDKPKTSLVNGKVVTGQLTLECRSKEANSAITGLAAS